MTISLAWPSLALPCLDLPPGALSHCGPTHFAAEREKRVGGGTAGCVSKADERHGRPKDKPTLGWAKQRTIRVAVPAAQAVLLYSRRADLALLQACVHSSCLLHRITCYSHSLTQPTLAGSLTDWLAGSPAPLPFPAGRGYSRR